ncbi:MAG: hypothetical protein WBE76_14560 [Terracidiphilus sp.]
MVSFILGTSDSVGVLKGNDLHRDETYNSDWWSIDLPPEWGVREDEECTTFTSTSSPGVLQVSAVRKPNGAVTLQDLQEFASGSPNEVESLVSTELGAISGVTCESVQNGKHWKKWWLRKGPILVFLTFNTAVESKDNGKSMVDKLIATLAIHE